VRERKQLAYDGVITPVVTINEKTGKLEATPEIVTRGVMGADGADGMMQDLQRITTQAVETASAVERGDLSLLKERVRLELKRFVQKETGARPVIVPVVVQV
jgi:ribonuclease J